MDDSAFAFILNILLFVVFSACGGIGTGGNMPVFGTYWERVDSSWHHKKVALLGSRALLPELEQVVLIGSSLADCQALT